MCGYFSDTFWLCRTLNALNGSFEGGDDQKVVRLSISSVPSWNDIHKCLVNVRVRIDASNKTTMQEHDDNDSAAAMQEMKFFDGWNDQIESSKENSDRFSPEMEEQRAPSKKRRTRKKENGEQELLVLLKLYCILYALEIIAKEGDQEVFTVVSWLHDDFDSSVPPYLELLKQEVLNRVQIYMYS
jgi:hypothetical protein